MCSIDGCFWSSNFHQWIQFKARISYKSGATLGGRKTPRKIVLDESIYFNGDKYEITVITIHDGTSVYSGHYRIFIKLESHWWKFDGQKQPSIEHIDIPREVLIDASKGYASAYVIIYEKLV